MSRRSMSLVELEVACGNEKLEGARRANIQQTQQRSNNMSKTTTDNLDERKREISELVVTAIELLDEINNCKKTDDPADFDASVDEARMLAGALVQDLKAVLS